MATTCESTMSENVKQKTQAEVACYLCGVPAHCKSRELCKAHYARLLRYGDPLGGKYPVTHGTVTCSVCGGVMRSFNRYGVCTRTKECRAVNDSKRARTVYVDNHARVILYAARRRAQKVGAVFSLTKDDLPVVPEECPILGVPLILRQGGPHLDTPSLDRRDPALGYIPTNVWWISHQANTMKGSADMPTLRRFAEWVLAQDAA